MMLKKSPALAAEAVVAHCHANPTGYKVSNHDEFREALPKSPIGKMLRRDPKKERSVRCCIGKRSLGQRCPS
ncbi:MAG TPA: hypothetical protein PK440_06320 [Candidatus Accumulibacter phosphatis]|nr:hypothetical protein [Accumulibacter sp.]HCN66734.1 hypothetical protein [Accumulibacter sp.]HCV12176.1 hypothetical protein [Accumulibacter sp.]HRL75644.1 hypothetical protein [Candidatus Accumulibacter phosphatis]HRQ94604.1 hypothetical protein [Candidatus Accumulibacter phosphatis]